MSKAIRCDRCKALSDLDTSARLKGITSCGSEKVFDLCLICAKSFSEWFNLLKEKK